MSAAAQQQAVARDALYAIFDEAWAHRLEEDPLFATAAGENQYNDRLPSVTEDDFRRRAEYRRGLLDRLGRLDRSALDTADRINYDIFRRLVQDDLTNIEYRGHLTPILADEGFHIDFARLPAEVPLSTTSDYENYIARLRKFPEYVEQNIGLMREGLKTGFTLPRIVLEGYDVTIRSHIVDDPVKSVFYLPFANFPTTVPQQDRARLEEAGRKAILKGAVAGYRRFLEFMTSEYVPGARTSIGASTLPKGRDYYRFRVRYYTTLDISPEEVHRIGRSEVERIRREMDEIIRQVGFKGDFAAFLTMLRTDPRFYAKSADDLLKTAAYIAKRMDGRLPSLFGKLPRLPYGIEPVPAHLAPKYTAGRYITSPIGSTQPGYYWVNTYALESRPLYALEALTLHEAVPGHHLQYALQAELTGVPKFRRLLQIDAFSEGWGLYAEHLGIEAGFYTDPYSNFGRLTYEMWRACRLVVDTGIHAMGWTRDQAMSFMASNTALSLHEVTTETDRYISWPGQALAYKMGELKIRELRQKAEKALGARFDVRRFHDAVLQNGPVPLPLLEAQIDEFVGAETRAR
jgi:uncharacterized protein (DUF885 family)